MSSPAQTNETEAEEVKLNLIPGTGDTQIDTCHQVVTRQGDASCCQDKNHRKLAICSIICGLSCIGINALIYSVKAETTTDPEAAVAFSNRAKKCGIISIVVWVSLLALTPLLMTLISYLLTLQD